MVKSFLVQFFCSSQNGWEPEENIYSKDLIHEFEKNLELEEKRRALKRTLTDSSNLTAAKRIKLGNEVSNASIS